LHRKIVPSGSTVAKPSGDHIPLGGFVLKTTAAEHFMQREIFQFQLVCKMCDGLGIIFECPENAPSSTPIKCRYCGAPRGTLGQLRELSMSGREDLFEA
jgi:hypothetical protein